MKRDDEQPLSKNTPNGGNIIAKINLKISEQVNAMYVKLSIDDSIEREREERSKKDQTLK